MTQRQNPDCPTKTPDDEVMASSIHIALPSAERLRAMHDVLLQAYGPQRWWPAKTRFEVILGAYLTQNTSWKSVERSLHNLREAGALNQEGIRSASLEQLRTWIRPSGFATRKASSIKAFMAWLDCEFAGSLRRMALTQVGPLRDQLLALPGVGPETADAILLYAFDKAVPVADEYLRRIASRHHLLEPQHRAKAPYHALVKLTASAFAADPIAHHAEHFNEFHALVVAVGKAHCKRTPDCKNCPLRYDLPKTTRPASILGMNAGRT